MNQVPPGTETSIFQTATGLKLSRGLVSYKDICMGVRDEEILEEGSSSEEEEGSMESGSEEEDDQDEFSLFDPLCPMVQLSKEERKRICSPWKHVVIIKHLGRRIGLRMLKARLSKMWQPRSGMEVIDLENEYFLVNFNSLDDLDAVFENGPWMIQDHYLVIQKWKPEFFPFEDDLTNVAAWVRIPCLPVEYYDPHVLRRIGDTLGRTVKINGNTLKEKVVGLGELHTERAKFARICTEVNIKKPLISIFELNGRRYRVEYEGLHLICFQCGCYGHRKESCPLLEEGKKDDAQGPLEKNDGVAPKDMGEDKVQNSQAADGGFGPWMMVQKGGRRRANGAEGAQKSKAEIKGNRISQANSKQGGSRFNILDNIPEVGEEAENISEDLVVIENVVLEKNKAADSEKVGISIPKKSKPFQKSGIKLNSGESKGLKIAKSTGLCKPATTSACAPKQGLPGTQSEVGQQSHGKSGAQKLMAKGRVGLHAKSRVGFKGVKDAARAVSSPPKWLNAELEDFVPKDMQDQDFFNSCMALGPRILGRAHASSSKPLDGDSHRSQQSILLEQQNVDAKSDAKNDSHMRAVADKSLDAQGEEVKDSVCGVIHEVYANPESVSNINGTLISLIPKVDHPESSGTIPVLKRFPNESMIWKGICNSWEFILRGTCWRVGDGVSTRFWTDCWLKSGLVLKDVAAVDIPEERLFDSVKDVSMSDGSWASHRFATWLPGHAVPEVNAHLGGVPELGEDRLIRNLSHNGSFSTKTAYDLIRDFPASPMQSIWRLIWSWKGPVRAQNFIWMLSKGGLKTNCYRWERGIASSNTCAICHAEVETDRHILLECSEVRGFWQSIADRPHQSTRTDLAFPSWLSENLKNAIVFNNKSWDNSGLLYFCISQAREFAQSASLGYSVRVHHSGVDTLIRWYPPDVGWCKWNLDGSVIQHRGVAASGVVLRDSNGNWMCGISRNVGHSSINVAELWAFLDAATVSSTRRDCAVCFESDSLKAVNFVKMGGNHVADALARLGHSLPLGCHVFDDPPPSIQTLLLGDSSGVFL
ncbi:Zinc finger, CCHC-type [Sesbania bispinosa]|nr:Zinc finger, CCHC-type [Sesbania bispinosa]